ncbi:MAG: hypothetical protein A2V83_10155 [Nitrospirae bacterium RBG_16_64_22]|nr:MAG: hypothetical protein A2V83_10155 [Nitrospirae bacterium RBG_16_64_22]
MTPSSSKSGPGVRSLKRVLVVDDSAFSRRALRRMIERSPDLDVIGAAANGEEAMRIVLRDKPDVITLDLEMPVMDGFAFLRWLMAERPTPVVVVSARDDDPSIFKAFDLGAVDFIGKPTARASEKIGAISDDLLEKIYAVAGLDAAKVSRRLEPRPASPRDSGTISFPSDLEVVALGASTGGPPAVQAIVTRLGPAFPAALIVAQHMPAGFTRQFADRLALLARVSVREAVEGEEVRPRAVYVAPGGKNLGIERGRGGLRTRLTGQEKDARYAPSVDHLMRSAAEACGARSAGVVLTGMGNDGSAGLSAIRAAGGVTIAESEATAVIYGMPREAVRAGAAMHVLDLPEIVEQIGRIGETGNR